MVAANLSDLVRRRLSFHPVLLAKNITPPPNPNLPHVLAGRAPPPSLSPGFAVLALQIRLLLVEGLFDLACLSA